MKFCKDCKHVRLPELYRRDYGCEKAPAEYGNYEAEQMVTGLVHLTPAIFVRVNESKCGTEGKWFEPK